MIEMFKEFYESRHEYAKNWKEKNKTKVIGYFCTYVPEEILYAGNILPVRILGSHETQSLTEPHIFGMYCPFCRDCLAQGLKGKYDYLNGIMIAQSCLHIRQAFTSWQLHIPIEYSYYLPFPNNIQSKSALPYLTEEYKMFKNSIEKLIGKKISANDLKRGIEIMNENRGLMRQIYEMRKEKEPKISGLEAMYMVVSSQFVDKREHSLLLKQVLKELPNREGKKGQRLILIGSEDDDTEFLKMVEGLNAIVVNDEHCTGTRYFWNDVEINGNSEDELLNAIAKRYIDRPPCPSKDWMERKRIGNILKLAKDWNVNGAILIQQKFCDPHELDIPMITENLKKNGIKSLFLEFDVTVPIGQFKTRVEAFLEMLREDELF